MEKHMKFKIVIVTLIVAFTTVTAWAQLDPGPDGIGIYTDLEGLSNGLVADEGVRWTPSFGQVRGTFKVDSQFFVMPLFSHCTLPSASCHRAGSSAAGPSCSL